MFTIKSSKDSDDKPVASTTFTTTTTAVTTSLKESPGAYKPLGRFRRRQNLAQQLSDQRHEAASARGRQAEACREEAPSNTANDGSVAPSTATTTTSSFFGGSGDKKQLRIAYRNFGEDPKECLVSISSEIPLPATDQHVVIKITASTVSYNDCVLRRGISFQVMEPIQLPATPGGDVVGYIHEVGDMVTNFKVGDRVAALVRVGGNARYVSVPASYLVEVPRSCDSAEAACMVSTYMTAYQSLRMVTKDEFSLNGKRILITGGIEPVGQALIQLCFRAGAGEVFVTAPKHRHKYIKSVLGATPLPLDADEWLPRTKGRMDIVFDGTCSDGLDSPYASLKSDGFLVCVGMTALLSKEQPSVFGAPISAYWTKLKGQLLSNTKSYEVWDSFNTNKEAYKLDLEILFHLLKKRFIKPHIAKRVALSEVPEAQALLESGSSRGEIVCLPWKRSNVSNHLSNAIQKLKGTNNSQDESSSMSGQQQ